jgi:hypothetical protein
MSRGPSGRILALLEKEAGTMWQVVCPETGWRSLLFGNRSAAEHEARSIDVEIARVNGLSAHRHPVVEVDIHAVDDVAPAAPFAP